MPVNHQAQSVDDAVRQLSGLLQRTEQSHRRSTGRSENGYVSSGCRGIDRLLYRGGFLRGSLVEWLGVGTGHGASLLALVAAREACADGGALVVVDRQGTFYPPTAAVWQIDLPSTIVVRPSNSKDHKWALDQALRCEDVAAVLAWPGQLDSYTFRRWQLAAESSGCLGLLIRPSTARKEPSWADVRLAISPSEPTAGAAGNRFLSDSPESDTATTRGDGACRSSLGWSLRVQLLRCRGRYGTGEIEVEISNSGEIHETHSGDLAPRLADPASTEQTA